MYGQVDMRAVHGRECIAIDVVIPRAEGEKVGWFKVGIVPFGKMPPVGEVAAGAWCAVREQDWIPGLVRLNAHFEPAHHIRSVGPIGDATEANALTLRTKPVT